MTEVYNKGESIFLDGKLCIINRGLVVRNGMIKSRGSTWGDDFVLSSSLRRPGTAMVLAFAELLVLQQDAFYEILSSANADDFRKCRKIIVRMTVMRGVVREAWSRLRQDPSLADRITPTANSKKKASVLI